MVPPSSDQDTYVVAIELVVPGATQLSTVTLRGTDPLRSELYKAIRLRDSDSGEPVALDYALRRPAEVDGFVLDPVRCRLSRAGDGGVLNTTVDRSGKFRFLFPDAHNNVMFGLLPGMLDGLSELGVVREQTVSPFDRRERKEVPFDVDPEAV